MDNYGLWNFHMAAIKVKTNLVESEKNLNWCHKYIFVKLSNKPETKFVLKVNHILLRCLVCQKGRNISHKWSILNETYWRWNKNCWWICNTFFLTAKIWRLSFASNFFKNPMMKKFFSAATVLIFEMCFETIRCEIEEGLNEREREREREREKETICCIERMHKRM